MAVRILDDVLVDQIAAGEVVERPASVVKELVENSLDAGATTVVVQLKGGGRRRVLVQDDGHGMNEHDAVMCLERHATSKIRTLDDLVQVASLGFRGEAIPSIASVSRFQILTRRHDAELGTRVRVDGGALKGVETAGCAPGTQIKVDDLFFNLPVRKAFLRTAATELGHCVDAVVREAMLRPDVDFRVTHEGRDVVRAPATQDRPARARALIGKDAEQLRPVDLSDRGIQVRGLVSPNGVHASSGRSVYLYVNGRFVRDPVLRRALREAYKGIVPRGRHPVVVLEVVLPPERVDVNAHPSKTEVRFHSPRDVVDVVSGGLREALTRAAIRRRIADDAFGSRTRRADPAAQPLPFERMPAHPDDDPTFTPSEPELPDYLAADVGPDEASPPPALPPTRPPADRPMQPPGEGAGVAPTTGALGPEVARPDRDPPASTAPMSALEAGSVVVGGELAVVATPEGLLLVDLRAVARHKAREVLGAGGDPQRLLMPTVVSVDRQTADTLVDQREMLESVGLSLARFSPVELVLKRVPAPLRDAAWQEILPRLPTRGGRDDLVEALARAAPASGDVLAALSETPLSDLVPPLARVVPPHALRRLLRLGTDPG